MTEPHVQESATERRRSLRVTDEQFQMLFDAFPRDEELIAEVSAQSGGLDIYTANRLTAEARAERDRYREALSEALVHLESYLRGESGLEFVEPYVAARRAAERIRAALDQDQHPG